VHRRLGGFCYELNGAFALLLEALGAREELRDAGLVRRRVPAGRVDGGQAGRGGVVAAALAPGKARARR
jgi:hypothetical protein